MIYWQNPCIKNISIVLSPLDLPHGSGINVLPANRPVQNLDEIVRVEENDVQNLPAPIPNEMVDIAAEHLLLNQDIEIERHRRGLPLYLIAIERVLGNLTPPSYLGPLNRLCRFCQALYFKGETTTRGTYTKCCKGGNVQLPPLNQMPELLKNLFNGTDPNSLHFKQNILRYNYAFQFISLEANLRDLPAGRAPPVYCIQGKMYHHISHVNLNQPIQRYGPIYFLTPDEAVEHRRANNNMLNADLLRSIEQILRQVNIYAQSYMHLRERYDLEVETIERLRQRAIELGIDPQPLPVPQVTLELLTVHGRNARPYDLPVTNEVAAVYRVNIDTPPTPNLRVYVRDDPARLMDVDYKSEIVDPMSFPLLFPAADPGWHIHLRHANNRRSITVCEYYAYRLAVRDQQSRFQLGGKLIQQYIVAAYIKIESNRLEFILRNQQRLRSDLYVGLADYLHRIQQGVNNDPIAEIGRMIILPSTFIGSPRAQQQNFQDAMSTVKQYGFPSLFITFTCNPAWREITENLPRGCHAQDNPTLVARVFQSKFQELLTDLLKNHVFGIHLANLAVIEFQKRGLPHAHILTIMRGEDRLLDPMQIDQFISAEIPDPVLEPDLFEIVSRNMVHGPCGNLNPQAVCMVDGKCSKDFPKNFSDRTIVVENGRIIYRRANNGRTVTITRNGRQFTLDNRWIVPYSPFLLLKYNCHTNVEACVTTNCVKYLYKYFFKGVDHALVRINAQFPNVVDYNEVESFLNARYLSAPEASWHILQYPMVENTHVVYRLCVHLPERQRVPFVPGFERDAMERNEITQLTGWFQLNQADAEANQYLYTEIPLHYVWNAAQRRWTRRRRGGDKVISRLYTVNIRDQELYYLRVLLLHVRGARSYEELRTVDGLLCDTFLQACQLRNLLADDAEWKRALREASLRQMPYEMRHMFAYMLIFCEISDKLALWNEFRDSFIEDFVRHGADQDRAVQQALAAIQKVLAMNGCRLSQFGLPEPDYVDLRDDPVDVQAERAEGERLRNQLNVEQNAVFAAVLNAVQDANEPNRLFFVNAAAGTGKSFTFRALISTLLGDNVPILTLAPTGLAASLLKGGRTIHSRFKLPLEINETTTTGVTPNSFDGNFFKTVKLVIIDEVSMVTRTIFHIIDKALQDICNDNRPFANKVVVLGGDFRQTLPVVVGGNRGSIVDTCLKSSPNWHLFTQLNLLHNERAGAEQRAFADWLLQLGNGTLPVFRRTSYGNLIQVPAECVVDNREALERFCFDDHDHNNEIPNAAILTPLNATCQDINDSILESLPGAVKIYLSADKIDTENDVAAEVANYPIEFLNSLTPNGFPTHRLLLKVGAIVVLLRNLNLRDGLCNGTRLIVRTLGNSYLEAEKLDPFGRLTGHTVFIPRIDLITGNDTLPFKLRRRQFPIKLAYAMTINKSQGQTFDKVGIYLPNPTFAHGQLYVAFSRARNFQSVKIFMGDNILQGKLNRDAPENVYTRNIVYREVL